ncbi:hypothetical protein [Nonomuraea typhae]|uniref:hypothetical protein n=1 Tax=Nonomuraea typhae TaxID=2603600 RepID=UPI0012F75A97|nr:hypothetical protein [Nonomuraea typhae]
MKAVDDTPEEPSERQRRAAMREGKRASRRIWMQAQAQHKLITAPMTAAMASALGATFVHERQERSRAESNAMQKRLLDENAGLIRAICREASEVLREHEANGTVTPRTRVAFVDLIARWRVGVAACRHELLSRHGQAGQLVAWYWEGVLRRRVRRRSKGGLTVGSVPVLDHEPVWDTPDELLFTHLQGAAGVVRRALEIVA